MSIFLYFICPLIIIIQILLRDTPFVIVYIQYSSIGFTICMFDLLTSRLHCKLPYPFRIVIKCWLDSIKINAVLIKCLGSLHTVKNSFIQNCEILLLNLLCWQNVMYYGSDGPGSWAIFSGRKKNPGNFPGFNGQGGPNRRAAMAELAADGKTRSPTGLLRSARDLHNFLRSTFWRIRSPNLSREVPNPDTCGQYRPVLPTFLGCGTSRERLGDLLRKGVDLKGME